MSEQNFSNPNNRPAWAWHMNEARWQEQLQNNPRAKKYAEKSESDDIAHPHTIQEENINATPLEQNIIAVKDSAANISDATYALTEEKEDSISYVEEMSVSSTETTTASPEDEKSLVIDFEQDNDPLTLNASVENTQVMKTGQPDSTAVGSSKISALKHQEAEGKPKYSYVKDECEQPVRGYKALIFVPLLTLTVLLAIHTSSFIYNFSDNLVLQNPAQITLAQNLNDNSTFFVPTFDNLPVKNISPTALWFLAAIYKWIPAPELLNLHLAAAITALLVLAGTCLLSRGTTPGRKDVALSAGLVLLASPLFLGLAWIFKTEMLVLALYTFSLSLLFLGLHKEKSASYYVLPGMVLGALSVLGCGPVLLIPLFLTPLLFLLLSGRIKRLAAKDTVFGFAALLIILALWLVGAITLNGSAALRDYLMPWWQANVDIQANLSLTQQLIFAGIVLLPWLLLPLLLIDRIALGLVKVSALRQSLRTQAGQGKLFLICSLLGVLPLLALDKLEHPLLALLLLPGIAVLSARAVLDMNLGRTRVFTAFCALLLLALAAFLALLPTETILNIIPWQLSFLQVAPLVAAAVLCVLFLLRAAKNCAGRALFVTFAISWLLLAQVFLVFGLPAVMPYLKIDHLRSDILTQSANYQTVLLDLPAWANYPPLPGAIKKKDWSEVKEMLYDSSVQVVLPGSLWSALSQTASPSTPAQTSVLPRQYNQLPNVNASSTLSSLLPATLGAGNQTAAASNNTLEPTTSLPAVSQAAPVIDEQLPFKETARQYLLLTPYVLARAEKIELSPLLVELRQKLKAVDLLDAKFNSSQNNIPVLTPFLVKIVNQEKATLQEQNKAAIADSKSLLPNSAEPSASSTLTDQPIDAATLPAESKNATTPLDQPDASQPDTGAQNATVPVEGALMKIDAQSPHEPSGPMPAKQSEHLPGITSNQNATQPAEKTAAPEQNQKQKPRQAVQEGTGQADSQANKKTNEQIYEQVIGEILEENMQPIVEQSGKGSSDAPANNAIQP